MFYYPGWHAYLLDPATGSVLKELPIALRGELGLMTVRLPAGTGQVLLRFEDTPVRRLGTLVSAGSMLLISAMIAAWVIAAVRRRRHRAPGAGAHHRPATAANRRSE
jgi:hypothetical protein